MGFKLFKKMFLCFVCVVIAGAGSLALLGGANFGSSIFDANFGESTLDEMIVFAAKSEKEKSGLNAETGGKVTQKGYAEYYDIVSGKEVKTERDEYTEEMYFVKSNGKWLFHSVEKVNIESERENENGTTEMYYKDGYAYCHDKGTSNGTPVDQKYKMSVTEEDFYDTYSALLNPTVREIELEIRRMGKGFKISYEVGYSGTYTLFKVKASGKDVDEYSGEITEMLDDTYCIFVFDGNKALVACKAYSKIKHTEGNIMTISETETTWEIYEDGIAYPSDLNEYALYDY